MPGLGDREALPAVTVVIPTHNRADLLRRSLGSALGQRGVDLTVVVVDDGSRSDVALAIRDLRSPRVEVVCHPRSRGVSAARNTGIALARTPWVAFLDDDDLWAPDKIASQLAALSSSAGSRWSCVGAVHVDDSLRPTYWQPAPSSGDVVALLSTRGGIPGGGSGVVVSTELAREVGGFDTAFSALADWDFYFRIGVRSLLASVNRPLVGYYRHPDSMFHDPETLAAELLRLDRKYRGTICPVRPDYATWAARLLLISLRSGSPRDVKDVLASEVARRAGRAALGGALFELVGRRLRGRARSRPRAWTEESLSWLTSPCEADHGPRSGAPEN